MRNVFVDGCRWPSTCESFLNMELQIALTIAPLSKRPFKYTRPPFVPCNSTWWIKGRVVAVFPSFSPTVYRSMTSYFDCDGVITCFLRRLLREKSVGGPYCTSPTRGVFG